MIARYRTKADRTQENVALVRRVFRELEEIGPQDVRYLCLKLDDDTFVHFVLDPSNVIQGLPAFQAFRRDVTERCAEAPKQSGVEIIGDYRMLAR